MDYQSMALVITTLLAVLWAGYERVTKRKGADADLTTAATELVDEVRGFYKERIGQLEMQHKNLTERVTRLEGMLEQYGCQVMDCPLRQPFHLAKLKM